MKTSVVSYPRIGALRELKFTSEKYFHGECSQDELLAVAKSLRREHWESQQKAGISLISSNDFSFYDQTLDAFALLGLTPQRYRDLGLPALDTYFAMARGYQAQQGDVHALPMLKWFNTNYHYIVPEFSKDSKPHLEGSKPFDEFLEARELGIATKPTLIGPFTLLRQGRYRDGTGARDFAPALAAAYRAILERFDSLGAEWVQLDEPALVYDLNKGEIELFCDLYKEILSGKGKVKVLLQTYFGDIRDAYTAVCALPVDGIGLDFVEGRLTLDLVRKNGFPEGKALFAGVLCGKNIWRNHYEKSVALLEELQGIASEVVISTSCSLLHVPYTLDGEDGIAPERREHFAFAREKLGELRDLSAIMSSGNPKAHPAFTANQALFARGRDCRDEAVQQRVAAIKDSDYTRLPAFEERERIQHDTFRLPEFPTTTIGSFPQTTEIKHNRAAFRKGEISREQYNEFNRKAIRDCVALQEEIGLDVLVHGEFERNDMVEYFGENLSGFLFTRKAWVQSYGTRCVKPPIIWGDISRLRPITVEWSTFAQSCTQKPMKGMLTGPVTIQNWSFPREDIPLRETALQLALVLRDEVLDLERNGIRIIQIDEAALREKLPLRKSDWKSEYLDWAIPAFRLVHSGVKPETQIHTHMCYSEFTDIIEAIDDMDADVITFEASRSDLKILDSLKEHHFRTEVGPGVYDIHSPRVPSTEEITAALREMLKRVERKKLWVNPDCGLKTRGIAETRPSLEHLVAAAKELRHEN